MIDKKTPNGTPIKNITDKEAQFVGLVVFNAIRQISKKLNVHPLDSIMITSGALGMAAGDHRNQFYSKGDYDMKYIELLKNCSQSMFISFSQQTNQPPKNIHKDFSKNDS